jgi:hypothetical protein
VPCQKSFRNEAEAGRVSGGVAWGGRADREHWAGQKTVCTGVGASARDGVGWGGVGCSVVECICADKVAAAFLRTLVAAS